MGKKRKNGFFKNFINLFGWVFARLALLVTHKLPERWIIPIGAALGKIFYYIILKYQRIGLKNLHFAFGRGKSEEELKIILKHCMENIGKNFMELAYFFRLSSHQIKQKIEVEGLENLDRAAQHKKGLIAFSAHLGNFMLIGPRLIAEGYSFSVIARDPKDKRIAGLFREMRHRLGVFTIPDKPKRECIALSLKCLRNNNILFLQIDQNASSDDPWVNFFGWYVPTFKGPVVFSLRTGAPILPVFMTRKPDNKLKLIIGKAIELKMRQNKEEMIKENIAFLTKVTEEYIRRYPEQWWWLHRRWKKAKKLQSHGHAEAAATFLSPSEYM